MNKQELATKIWSTANELRKNIKASEYKDYILGFMFYKYLCDKEVDYLHDLDGEIDDLKDVDDKIKSKFKDDIGYFISYDNLFHVWKESGISLGAKQVAEALDDFYLNLNGKYKRVFDKVFSALQKGLSRFGEENAGSRDKAVRDIVDLVDNIPPTSRNYDVLGYIYEYLIQQFSSEAKKDGAFYTPHQITSMMSRILAERLKDRDRVAVYDPTVGSGGLLLNIGKEIGKYVPSDNISYYGQELITETANLAKMNLFMQGIPVQNITMRNADTLDDDWPYFDEKTSYAPLFVDAVVSNPPYSVHYKPEDHQTDERFKGYGLAPAGKADYAFLLHCLYHIKNDGVMAIVLPHGVLFRGDSEGEIRKNLVLNHNIETIIGLPSQLFFATPIAVIVMILSKNRQSDDILFIDASQSFKKEKKQNILSASDVQRICDTVAARKGVPDYAHLASLDEIKANDYNLNIPRYVSAAVHDQPYDIYSVMTGKVSDEELSSFSHIWKEFPSLCSKLIEKGEEYNNFRDVDIKETVFSDPDVKSFLSSFNERTREFRSFLTKTLVDRKATSKVYDEITAEIFDEYSDLSLVDVYSIFQAFVDNWDIIDDDLSRLEKEGWKICSETEPNMIVKKDSKTKKTHEEQKGWKGKIIPFDFVKKEFFSSDYEEMARLTAEADKKAGESEEIWECMDEDSKALVSKEDDETAFDTNKFKSAIKSGQLEKEAVESVKAIQDCVTKEKALNKKVTAIAAGLDDKAKEKVETLKDDEINVLLESKWVTPIVDAVNNAAENVISGFVLDFEALKKKYSDPMADLSSKIQDTTDELKEMLDNLCGNDIDMTAIDMLLEEL